MKSKGTALLILTILLLPACALAGKDPSAYPIKVVILSLSAQGYHPVPEASPYGREMVYGRGNVGIGKTWHAFEFQYDTEVDSPTLPKIPISRLKVYPARWKRPQHKLELLIPTGKKGKYEARNLYISMLEGVYVNTGQGFIAISQDDYRARLAHGEGTLGISGMGQLGNFAILSITSTSDRAEINLDGEFVGTTPSILDVRAAEHTIILKKSGYKRWQRTTVLGAGRIKVQGDLDPEDSK